MSDSGEERESRALKGWAVVGEDGELMSEDGDSETSESSIEIVSVEGNEVTSHHHGREARLRQDEVVAETISPSAHLVAEAEVVQEPIDTGEEDAESSQDAVLTSNESGVESLGTDLTTAQSSTEDDIICSSGISTKDVEMRDDEIVKYLEMAVLGNLCAEQSTSASSEKVEEVDEEEVVPVLAEPNTLTIRESDPLQKEREGELSDTSRNFRASPHMCKAQAGEVSADEPGAVCVQLLADRRDEVEAESKAESQPVPDMEDQCPTPNPASPEDAEVSQLSGAGAEGGFSSRSDSDTDSDFVRLDSDQYESHENGEERVVLPLRLRATSSIGPSFSFMRGMSRESVDRQSPSREYVDVGEEDVDDETESSTEDGVDDRIESEQSEAGSLSAQNDIGDLSVFADIGDLPLEAGNVPRNYIHRPNNHLSTVLNIIVVVAAILTMGISLGIIMATDLEIEEWQTAHEFQMRRAGQLEFQLHGKSKVVEQQAGRLREQELLIQEMRNNIKSMERQTKGYERALDALAAYRIVDGGNVGKTVQLVKDATTDYVSCVMSPSQPDCHLRLVPYFNTYTTLLMADTSGTLPPLLRLDEKYLKDGEEATLLKMLKKKIAVAGDDAEEVTDGKDRAWERQVESDADHSSSIHPQPLDVEDEQILPENEGEEDAWASDSQKPGAESVQALPIELDLRQLQQSVTREQERALHWQQLYLAERRQREKEREEEEWEDERDREMREREKEQLDSVECLKKLMFTNLTTLTQHVARWNVSVFDDFANLSMLMSGVAELKQAVVDSFHQVWQGADQMMGNMHGEELKELRGQYSFPQNQKVVEYLKLLLEQVKNTYVPDRDDLVDSLSEILTQIKDGMESMFTGVNTDFVVSSVERIWEEVEEMMHKLHTKEKEEEKAREVHEDSKSVPDQTVLAEHLARVLNELKHGVEDVIEKVIVHDHDEHGKDGGQNANNNPKSDQDSYGENWSGEHTGPGSWEHEELPGFNEEMGGNGQGFWSKKIVKILKKTSGTIRKLGRRVAKTWDSLKNVWHDKKPTWQKINKLWHVKKRGIFNFAKRFTSRETQTSPAGALLCAKLPKDKTQSWKQEWPAIDIHCKSIQKLRKKWQRELFDDECGRYSPSKVKSVMHAFHQLLSIPVLSPEEASQLSKKDVAKAVELFTDFKSQFLQQRNSQFLLRTDRVWIDCQLWWWLTLYAKLHSDDSLYVLPPNKCNSVRLQDNFGYFDNCGSFRLWGMEPEEDTCRWHSEGEQGNMELYCKCDKGDGLDYVNISERKMTLLVNHLQMRNPEDHEDGNENNNDDQTPGDKANDDHRTKLAYPKINETSTQDDDSGEWYLERARYRLQLRREKAKADWQFEMAADREEQRQQQWRQEEEDVEKKDCPSGQKHGNGKDMKDCWGKSGQNHQPHRRTSHWKKKVDKKEKPHFKQKVHKKQGKQSDGWFMKQAENRQKQREREHQADWVFERAADRKHGHRETDTDHHSSHRQKQWRSGNKDGKQFRHTYGKVRS